MSQLTYPFFTSHLPQGVLTGSTLKGGPRALPHLPEDLSKDSSPKDLGRKEET